MSSHLLLSMHAGRAHVKALSKRKESGALCASKPYLFLATGHAGLLDLLSFQRQAVCVGANEFDCGGCGARAAAHGDGHDGRAGEWASAKKICDRPARLTSGTFFFCLPLSRQATKLQLARCRSTEGFSQLMSCGISGPHTRQRQAPGYVGAERWRRDGHSIEFRPSEKPFGGVNSKFWGCLPHSAVEGSDLPNFVKPPICVFSVGHIVVSVQS